MPGASNDGGEDSPGGVVTGEPGLAHTGPVVHDQSGNLVVTHCAEMNSNCNEYLVLNFKHCTQNAQGHYDLNL